MKWVERPDILSYIIDCYAGVDGNKRQFIWEEVSGDVVIGNARAFTDHVSERFGLGKANTAWTNVHEALRALGEVVHLKAPRARVLGGKFRNQEPETRIIKKRS